MPFILGKKIGMAQVWRDKKVVPVTIIGAGPCVVTQLKNQQKDGYQSVQIGFEKITKEKKIKKTQKNKPYRWLREFKKDPGEYKLGDVLDVSKFKIGEKVKISGVSKGKGFQGGVKRWGFAGRNATHGVKHEHRTIGSTGSCLPERVRKGKKMPGRMGQDRITVKNLEIMEIDQEKNLIAVKGAVPGSKDTLLEIRN